MGAADPQVRKAAGVGYTSAEYAFALAEFGQPRSLPRAGGWLIERPVPGATGLRDARGPYPLFACTDWEGLGGDLAALEGELVSLTLVTDPFGAYRHDLLAGLFPDLMRPYKPHFVVDLHRPLFAGLSAHHRRNLRRALHGVSVEICDEPRRFIEDWTGLYEVLIARHGIRGMAAFSRQSFTRQFEVPGLVMLRATEDARTVAMHLWIRNGRHAYYHLGAANARGYALRAAYALMHHAVEHFAQADCEQVDIGAGPGADGDGEDGLTRFKRGWSTGTRTVYLCGRILDRPAYAELARQRPAPCSGYFPVYRSGEFQ